MIKIARYLDTPNEVFAYGTSLDTFIFVEDFEDGSRYAIASAFPNSELVFEFSGVTYEVNPVLQNRSWCRVGFEHLRQHAEDKGLDGVLLLDGCCYDIYYSKSAKVLLNSK